MQARGHFLRVATQRRLSNAQSRFVQLQRRAVLSKRLSRIPRVHMHDRQTHRRTRPRAHAYARVTYTYLIYDADVIQANGNIRMVRAEKALSQLKRVFVVSKRFISVAKFLSASML